MLSACLNSLNSLFGSTQEGGPDHVLMQNQDSLTTSAHSKSKDSLDDSRSIMAIFLGWLAKRFPILFAYINSQSKSNVNWGKKVVVCSFGGKNTCFLACMLWVSIFMFSLVHPQQLFKKESKFYSVKTVIS